MATIYIENKPYEADESKNLLDACLALGFDIPYFCWHPAIGSVGACRQCAVKLFKSEDDQKGTIVMSCMTPVKDGMRLSIDDNEVKQFRKRVIEWLMLNHPHDCPVCDEGGECHLQDMTVMTGHVYRKTRLRKRTWLNQYLGPFVNHEMNRCIQCYRCVRFYRDYAGGRDFNVFGCHDYLFFGRYKDGILENEFSGNLVEICPTGVFTDATLKKHYTRKWDLQTAPSVCVHCSLGCNTIPGERYGLLRRVLNRYNGDVNGYFICDRGRYGYGFVNNPERIKQPVLREGGITKIAPLEEVDEYLKGLFRFGGRAIGIGSPKASLEANYALRTLVGPDSFYAGMPAAVHSLVRLAAGILKESPVPAASLSDIESSDAVLILGEDVTNTAPRMALAIRQSIRQAPMKLADKQGVPGWNAYGVMLVVQDTKGALFIASPVATKLDDVSTGTYRAAPEDIAAFGFAIAHEIHDKAPLSGDFDEDERDMIRRIAGALMHAEKPLIVSGTGCMSASVLKAAANIAWALDSAGRKPGLSFVVPDCNSMGLALLGGGSADEAFKAIETSGSDTLIVLESDLYALAARAAVDSILKRVKRVIVLDSLPSETASAARLLLPAATFAESDGTFINNEGRAQRFYKVLPPPGEVRESLHWLAGMLKASENPVAAEWHTTDDIDKALADEFPLFGELNDVAPPAGFRISGMKVPRQPHRCSGRTAMHADISVNEPKPPDDPDSPLAFTMEGFDGVPPPQLITRYWAPAWNSVQALAKFQSEIAGPLRGGNPGIRLIRPAEGRKPDYFRDMPEPVSRASGEWLVVPLYHIFGSERYSMFSPPVAELAAQPYLAVTDEDAELLKVADGDMVTLLCKEGPVELPVKKVNSIPAGVTGLPCGLAGLKWIDMPASCRIEPAEKKSL